MKILQNQTVFEFIRFLLKRWGTNNPLFLWKGCQLQKRLGTYANTKASVQKDWTIVFFWKVGSMRSCA